MSVVQKNVEVSKECSELADCLVKLVEDGKAALADGFQLSEDVPAVLLANLPKLMAALEGLDKLDDEFKENPKAFLAAWAVAGANIAGGFLQKEPAA